MTKTYISPEEGKELETLYEQYNNYIKEALKVLKSPPYNGLEGKKLENFLAADIKAGEAAKRIHEILGE